MKWILRIGLGLGLLGQTLSYGASPPVHQITVGPDQRLEQVVADVPPGSKALITVLPGTYNARRLLKNEVDWHFLSGAVVTNYDTTGNLGGWGIFDDRDRGAITSNITGDGEFYMAYSLASTNGGGVLLVTNPLSRINLTARQLRIGNVGGNENQGIAAVHSKHGTNRVAVAEMVDPFWQGTVIGEDLTQSGADGIYWEAGDLTVHAKLIEVGGYAYYGLEPAGGATNNFVLEADLIRTFWGACLYQVGNANAASGYRSWIRVKEIERQGSAGFSAISFYGGRCYVEAQKIGVTNNALPVVLMQQVDQVSWLTAQKITGNYRWLDQRTGTVYLAVQHYEDLGSTGIGLRLGGTAHIGPGSARIINGQGVQHWGPGTNRLTGLTIDTQGTNTTASTTNNWPVLMYNGTSNLVLNGCALLGPIATAGGGAHSLYSTSGPSHVLIYNGTVANSNANNVNWVVSALSTNNSQMR